MYRIHGKIEFGIKFEFRAVLLNPDGSIAQDNGWQTNQILDTGLIKLGASYQWSAYCHIGSNPLGVTVSQTSLQTWLAVSTGKEIFESNSIPTAPDYETSGVAKYRWNAGVGTGTIREMGINDLNTNVNLVTRALVSPAITKSSVQILDIYYRFTVFPKLTDTITNNVDVEEDGVSTLYDVTSRPSKLGEFGTNIIDKQFGTVQYGWHRVTDGVLGAITGSPSGNQAGGSPLYITGSTIAGPISLPPNSAYIDHEMLATLDQGNLAAGIRCVLFRHGFNFDWQLQYDSIAPTGRLIPKDNTKELKLYFRIIWTRL